MAQQFLSTVANSSQVVYQRPINDPTTESVLLYTLREEIRATAKTGLDSGFDHNITIKVQLINVIVHISGLLQILFLAGATGYFIQQHCEEPHELYQLQLSPCACCESYRGVMHIMLVQMSYEKSIPTVFNHIIPLAPISNQKGMKTHNYSHILVLSTVSNL